MYSASLVNSTICLFTLLFSMSVLAKPEPEPIKPLVDPDYTPDPSTDEGGFWYKVNSIEEKLKASPYLIRDEELNRYISGLVCKLAGDYCSSIRVYIVDNPHFNATMYPNGMMNVWTGLLLRVKNEEQLVSVLAHEIAHYLRTHQIIQWRKLRSGLAVTTVLDVTLTFGLATLSYAGSAAGFSREQETEADEYGVQLMVEQGYSPYAAPSLWKYVQHEREKDQSKSENSSFLATHPSVENRIDNLSALAKEYGAQKETIATKSQSDLLLNKLVPHYVPFMKNYMALREYEQLEALLQRHEEIGYPKGAIEFFRGEMHRLRDGDGDRELAIAAYERSISSSFGGVPVAVYRELGYLNLKKKNNTEALKYFNQYLSLDETASDREMILFYTDSLKGK